MTVLVEVVEMPNPVRTHGEDIDVVFLYVVYLLPEIILDDDLVGDTRGFDRLNAFQHIVLHVELAAQAVEIIVRHTHDEVIAQCLGTFQQVDMPLVKQVVSTICDYFFHKTLYIIPFLVKKGKYESIHFTQLVRWHLGNIEEQRNTFRIFSHNPITVQWIIVFLSPSPLLDSQW